MKRYDNGKYIELTPEEITENKRQITELEKEYWANVPYDDAVNTEIRKQYTESQEFAILRQKEEKPEEYKAYFDYCESCKAYVKSKKGVE